MTFIAVHRSRDASIATDRLVLDASELHECESAAALLDELQRLRADALAEAETARRQGFERGLAEGRERALRDTAPALLAAWRDASERERHGAEAMQQAVITLALHVVRRLADEWGDAETVAALARRAWQALAQDRPAVLRVSPLVHAALCEAWRAEVDSAAGPEIRADEGLDAFACILETPSGQLIAGLDAQLARVEAGLRRAGRGAGRTSGLESSATAS